jgi:hypothetical protein
MAAATNKKIKASLKQEVEDVLDLPTAKRPKVGKRPKIDKSPIVLDSDAEGEKDILGDSYNPTCKMSVDDATHLLAFGPNAFKSALSLCLKVMWEPERDDVLQNVFHYFRYQVQRDPLQIVSYVEEMFRIKRTEDDYYSDLVFVKDIICDINSHETYIFCKVLRYSKELRGILVSGVVDFMDDCADWDFYGPDEIIEILQSLSDTDDSFEQVYKCIDESYRNLEHIHDFYESVKELIDFYELGDLEDEDENFLGIEGMMNLIRNNLERLFPTLEYHSISRSSSIRNSIVSQAKDSMDQKTINLITKFVNWSELQPPCL